MSVSTFPQQVLGRLDRDRDCTRFRFANGRGRVVTDRSLGEVISAAQRIGTHLRDQAGLVAGDRVALAYSPSLDFVEAMAACLLYGLVPCPLMPPDPTGSDAGHLAHVCQHANARAILTHRPYRRARFVGRVGKFVRGKRGGNWPRLPWIVTDVARAGRDVAPHRPAPGELAFLQYTSGSTAVPKGVRVTHANLAHQLAFHHNINRSHLDSELMVWLPQYHDFGLICGILSALWGNGSLTLMSPFDFLKRPAAWAEVLQTVRATHTAAPNFGYELLIRKTTAEQRAQWDLSRMSSWCSAAEPVRSETVDRFLSAFAPCGVTPATFHPAYGLAEHVVGVTVRGQARLAVDPDVLRTEGRIEATERADAKVLIGCGIPASGLEVRIVDPDTHELLPSDQVGEIWLHGPSVCDGYVSDLEQSRQVFEARLRPDDGRAWLRTGDMGVLLNREIVVTGRLKDLIIVRGRNVHPSDIEDAARIAHPEIRPGGLVAFGYAEADGSDALGLIAEVRDDSAVAPDEVVTAVRESVRAHVPGISPSAVVVGRRGLISKTTSGKVRRKTCRDRFVSGAVAADPRTLLVVRQDAARVFAAPPTGADHAADKLESMIESVLGRPLEAGELNRSPAELGMDSLMMMTLGEQLEALLGEPVPSDVLLGASSLRMLATRLGLASGPRAHPPKVRSVAWSACPPAAGPTGAVFVGPSGPPPGFETAGSDGVAKNRVVVDARDAKADPAVAIERCRRMLSEREEQEVVVLVRRGLTGVGATGPCEGAAAVVGFVRSLRSADPAGGWRVRDLESLGIPEHLLFSEPVELAVRDGRPVSGVLETVRSGEHGDAPDWGGRALLVGHGVGARIASLWLARSLGIEQLTWIAPEPLDDGDRSHIDALRDADVEVELAATPEPGDWRWIVHAMPAPRGAAAGRQTRARVRRAWKRGPEQLQVLFACAGEGSQLLVMGDGTAHLGAADQGAWGAANACMAAMAVAESAHRPALFVDLGPVEGIVTSRELRQRWRPAGIVPMTAEDAAAALDLARASRSVIVALWSMATVL